MLTLLKKRAQENNLEEYTELLEQLSTPCLLGVASKQGVKLGDSKVGGFPHVNGDFNWPTYQGTPLEFIAQINLAELAEGDLPKQGLLLFFYADGVWADEKAHKDFIRVIYMQDTQNLEIQEPTYQYKKRLWGLLQPQQLPTFFDEHRIQFRPYASLPDLDNAETIPALSVFEADDWLSDAYCDLKYDLSDEGVLQIGGYPNVVQYDGIAAGAASIMGKGTADDWQLLLEVDSQLGFMWGDAGRLYFCIHKDDLAAANFTDVWMDFQCH